MPARGDTGGHGSGEIQGQRVAQGAPKPARTLINGC
jgi:hypothetical protein